MLTPIQALHNTTVLAVPHGTAGDITAGQAGNAIGILTQDDLRHRFGSGHPLGDRPVGCQVEPSGSAVRDTDQIPPRYPGCA